MNKQLHQNQSTALIFVALAFLLLFLPVVHSTYNETNSTLGINETSVLLNESLTNSSLPNELFEMDESYRPTFVYGLRESGSDLVVELYKLETYDLTHADRVVQFKSNDFFFIVELDVVQDSLPCQELTSCVPVARARIPIDAIDLLITVDGELIDRREDERVAVSYEDATSVRRVAKAAPLSPEELERLPLIRDRHNQNVITQVLSKHVSYQDVFEEMILPDGKSETLVFTEAKTTMRFSVSQSYLDSLTLTYLDNRTTTQNISGERVLTGDILEKPLVRVTTYDPYAISGHLAERIYGVSPESSVIESGSVSAIAKGTVLHKCVEWDFERGECLGTWTRLQSLTPGKSYSAEFSASDPGYAEDNWYDHNFTLRKEFLLEDNANTDLVSYPFEFVLDTASLISAGKMTSTCNDMRFTDENNSLLSHFINFDECDKANTTIWVKVPYVAAGGNATVYLYFDNENAGNIENETDVFRANASVTQAYVVDDDAPANGIRIMAFHNDTTITVGATSVTIDQFDIAQFGAANISANSPIKATGPISGASEEYDVLVPISFARRTFVTGSMRGGAGNVDVVSPFGTTQVRVRHGGNFSTFVTNLNLNKGAHGETSTNLNNAVLINNSQNATPFLVTHMQGSRDNFVVSPPDTKFYGIGGNAFYLVALENNTDVTVYWSDGTSYSPSGLLGAGATLSLSQPADGGTGSNGDEATAYIVASRPMAGLTQGDGDGSESTSFTSLKYLDKDFLLPFNFQYLAIATRYPSTNCYVKLADGTIKYNQTSDADPYPTPGRFYFGGDGTDNTAAPAELHCNKPVAVIYETVGAGEEEHNVYGMKAARQYVYPEPSISEVREEQFVGSLKNITLYEKGVLVPFGRSQISLTIRANMLANANFKLFLTLLDPDNESALFNTSMSRHVMNGSVYYEYTVTNTSKVGNYTALFAANYSSPFFETFNETISVFESQPPYALDKTTLNDSNPQVNATIGFNVTWNDSSGLQSYIFSWNGTIDGSWQNDSPILFTGLENESFVNKTVYTYLSGKRISFKFYAFDIYGNYNESIMGDDYVQAVADGEKPRYNALYALPTVTGYGQTVKLYANVTDNIGIGSVTATVDLPNGSSMFLPLTFESGDLWYVNFTNTWRYGNYNFSFTINDTSDNQNVTVENSFFIGANYSLTFNTTQLSYGANSDVDLTRERWVLEEYQKSIDIIVENNSLETISELVLPLTITSSDVDFSDMRGDRADMRFVQDGFVLDHYLERYNSSELLVWVKMNFSGTETITLYYGKSDAASISSFNTTFTYRSPKRIYHVVSNNIAGNMHIASLIDFNEVIVDEVPYLINKSDILVIAAYSPTTKILSTGPLAITYEQAGSGSEAVPLSFAGNLFSYLSSSARTGNDDYDFFAPFNQSTVVVRNGSWTPQDTVVVGFNSTGQSTGYDLSDEAGIVTASSKVLGHYNIGGNDFMAMLPVATEWLGVPSQRLVVGIPYNDTDVYIYYSDGTFSSANYDTGEFISLSGLGTQGAEPATRIVATKPITAHGLADGDDTEGLTFFSPEYYDTEFVLPSHFQFLAIATDEPDTTCSLYDETGTFLESGVSGSQAKPYPNYIFIGQSANGQYGDAGSRLVCDNPVVVYVEGIVSATTTGEYSIYGMKSHRAVAEVDPTITYTSPVSRDELSFANSGETNTSSYLRWYVEHYEVGSWSFAQQLGLTSLYSLSVGESADVFSTYPTFNTAAYDDGLYRIVASPTDAASYPLSNASSQPFIFSREFSIDTQPPTFINNTANASSLYVGQQLAVEQYWIDVDGIGNFTMFWNVSGSLIVGDATSFSESAIIASKNVSTHLVAEATVPLSAEAKNITYFFNVADAAGNTNSSPESYLYVFDETPPTFGVPSVIHDPANRTQNVSLSIPVVDNGEVQTVFANVSEHGGNSSLVPFSYNVSTDTYVGWFITYASGEHNITFNATDRDGNSNATMTTMTTYGLANVSINNLPLERHNYSDAIVINCSVLDRHTAAGIQGYAVQFFLNGSLQGSNNTDAWGYAFYSVDTTGFDKGTYILGCAIGDNVSLYYLGHQKQSNVSTILDVPELAIINVATTHVNNEFETGDNLTINVTLQNVGNSSAFSAQTEVSILGAEWYLGQNISFGTIDKDITIANTSISRKIPTTASRGTYALSAVTTWQGGGSPPVSDVSSLMTLHRLADNTSSELSVEKIIINESVNYSFTVLNPWSNSITGLNLTIVCSPLINCTCQNVTGANPQTCTYPVLGSGSNATFMFNISSNASTTAGDYDVNITLRYLNPAGTFQTKYYLAPQTVQIREPTKLRVRIDDSQTTLIRGTTTNISGFVNNTGLVDDTNVWLGYVLPAGLVNDSGPTNLTGINLVSHAISWNNLSVLVESSSSLGQKEVSLYAKGDVNAVDWETLDVNVFAQPSIAYVKANSSQLARNVTTKLSAFLRLDNGTPITNAPIKFRIGGQLLGTKKTNATGIAELTVRVPYNHSLGATSVNASYAGNASRYYVGTSSQNSSHILTDAIKVEVKQVPSHVGFGSPLIATLALHSPVFINNVTMEVTRSDATAYNVSMTRIANFGSYVGNTYVKTFVAAPDQNWVRGAGSVKFYMQNTKGLKNETSMQVLVVDANLSLAVNLSQASYVPGELLVFNDPWILDNFSRRKLFTITNNDVFDYDGFGANITVNTQALIANNKLRADCLDVRFAHKGSENKLMPYRLVSGCNTTTTLFRVKVPHVGAGENASLYMYYGKHNASNTSQLAADPLIVVGSTTITSSWKSVSLPNTFTNPVVIAQPPNEAVLGDSGTTRIKEVDADSFSVYFQEEPGADGIHLQPENITYLVIEKGVHWLPSGERVIAGLFNTSEQCVGGGTCTYETITYPVAFAGTPSVIPMVQTENNAEFVFTGQTSITATTTDLSIGLSALTAGSHGQETIGYLAGTQHAGTMNSKLFEFDTTANSVLGHDDARYTWTFPTVFGQPPLFVGALSTRDGADGGWLRTESMTATTVDLHVDEDTVADAEQGHIDEEITYFAIEQAGVYALESYVQNQPTIVWGQEEAQPNIIFNNGSTNTSARIKISLWKNASGVWTHFTTLVSPDTTYDFVIDQNKRLSDIFASYNTSSLSSGSYRFNVTLTDELGTALLYTNNSPMVFVASFVITPDPVNITLISPQANIITNNWVNFTFNATSAGDIENCSLLINSSLVMQNSSTINESLTNYFFYYLPTGTYNWSVQCADSYGAENFDPGRTIIITDIVGNVSYINTSVQNVSLTVNGSVVNNSADYNGSLEIVVYQDAQKIASFDYNFSSVPFNFSRITLVTGDRGERAISIPGQTNIRLFIPVNDSQCNLQVCSGAFSVDACAPEELTYAYGMPVGGLCTAIVNGTSARDDPDNSDVGLTEELIITNTSFTKEGDNVSLQATIVNYGNTYFENLSVYFGDTTNNRDFQTVIIENLTVGTNQTINISFSAFVGDSNVVVYPDQPNEFAEYNESNNKVYKLVPGSMWLSAYGNISTILSIGGVRNWSVNWVEGLVLATTGGKTFDFSNLYPLTQKNDTSPSSNDFGNADNHFNSSEYAESVHQLFTRGTGTPIALRNMQLGARTLTNVPIINSTNTSASFVTGILWEYDGGNAEYDGSQQLVFATPINSSTVGQYGTYDFEMRLPAPLRSGVDEIDIYVEVAEYG
ncbi:MAG: DUF2341 domain-containing protein [Candidatus Woesearchaeota archaeon]|nr:MAG: DUF2341 domain-containing protein [Candidatus Woesearchaeota archaeon]